MPLPEKKIRLSRLLAKSKHSFFLFGPRGTGKSSWIKEHYPEAFYIDLLDTSTYLKLGHSPSLLYQMLSHLPRKSWVVIDEVQKLPSLLSEVHRLMEDKDLRFGLTGSSARKLRRGEADLLAGRAITLELEPFVFEELGSSFDLSQCLNWGGLPLVYTRPEIAKETLNSYVHTYLREEIREEGLVRKLEPFVRFLQVAGIMNGQILNLLNIAGEAQVPRSSLSNYFEILEETLLGFRLPAYQPGLQVREVGHPKFYFFDPGVARAAAGLLDEPLDSSYLGVQLETWIYHEIRVALRSAGKNYPVYYYRTGSGSEIDFVIETKRKTLSRKPEVILIEVKASKDWNSKYEKATREFAARDKVNVARMIGVYQGKTRLSKNGFDVFTVEGFLKELPSLFK